MARMLFADAAYVDREKITDYLLNVSHPQGGPKAAVFVAFGFDPLQPDMFADAVLKLARTGDAIPVPAVGGTKYVADGPVDAPNGRTLWLRTVWKDDNDIGRPRLITAYPEKPPA